MKKIIHLFILSCKKASYYIEKEQVQRLSYLERIQMNWHLRICVKCSTYKVHSHYVEHLLKKNNIDLKNLSNLRLSGNRKEQLKKEIEKAMNNY